MKDELSVFELHLKYIYEYYDSYDKYSVLQNKASKEIKQKQKEARREVLKSYNDDLTKLNKKRALASEEFNQHKRVVKRVTTFDIKDLGIILERLISTYEDTTYIYQSFDYIKMVDNIKGECNVHLITEVGVLDDINITEENIKKLKEEGKALLFCEKNMWHKKDDSVELYEINHMGIFKEKFVSKFSYVDEFLDYVINYRYHNKLTNITYEKLEELLNSFLYKKRTRLEISYLKQAKEELENLTSSDNYQKSR